MALEPAQFLHPLDGGGTGEFKESYAAVPSCHASWSAAIQALIDAAPYESEAKNKAWLYTELYSIANNESGGGSSLDSYQLGEFEVKDDAGEVNTVDLSGKYAYWFNKLSRMCKTNYRPYVGAVATI